MKDLVKLLATELAKKGIGIKEEVETEKQKPGAPGFEENVHIDQDESPKTLLQLSSIPMAINLDLYKNPHSGDNPTGDYKSAYRFSMLASPIPLVQPQYDESLNTVEKVWGNLLYGATSTSPYTQHLLQESQNMYKASSLSSMAGIPNDWYPVYAKPSDWYTIAEDEANLVDIEIDLEEGEILDNEFITLNGNTLLSWKSDTNKETIPLHENTNIKKIKLKVLQVDFVRPWLDFEIFNLKNWKIEGITKEYFSNGKIENNQGVFPLITQTILVGTKVSVEGDFDDSDVDVMKNSKNKSLSMGPFLLNTGDLVAKLEKKQNKVMTVTSNIKHIVGYLSRVVPISPCLE